MADDEQHPGEDPAEPAAAGEGAEPGETQSEGGAPGAGAGETPAGAQEDEGGLPSLDEMMEAIRQASVAQLLLSTVSTLASVAYGKLEVRDLPEAQRAIDAIGAVLPLLKGQVDEGILRDFEQALTNLKLAYADAVASAE